MLISISAVIKSCSYTPADSVNFKRAATKIKMFDLESGDDVDLKFPGEIKIGTGTPVSIEGKFNFSKYQNYTTLTAIENNFIIEKSGSIVLDSIKKGGDNK